MSTFVSIVGWIVVAALAVALAASAIALALHCYGKAMERFEWAVASRTRTEVGRSIGASAWWFSENPDTSLALRILSQRLMEQGGADADQWREQWRKARATPAEVANG